MIMDADRQLLRDYERVERAITYIDEQFPRQPSLAEVAASVDLSEYHFQRLFSRWVGISPKRFQQFLSKEHAKETLARSRSILEATYGAGLSSPSRLHDLMVSCEAVTPGEYRSGGAGLDISHGFHATPFGECLVAETPRGICWMSFVQDDDRTREMEQLRKSWPHAHLVEDPASAAAAVARVFHLEGVDEGADTGEIRLVLRGTNFQIKVWEALLAIPPGFVVAYEDVAQRIGRPQSSRAVGNAVGSNPISYLIPCHRVIRKVGTFGNYGGGRERKKAILAWESVKSHAFGGGPSADAVGSDPTRSAQTAGRQLDLPEPVAAM
jgi:AraC family transcriptional regulator of adaptative response/methylated-DNA-[protein]-cysteine methyltransferase